MAAKGGMFAGADWGSAIQAMISGALAARGNPAGMAGLQILSQRQREKLEESQYQRHRQDSLADYAEQQRLQQMYGPGDEFAQMMAHAGIDPNSEQGRQMYVQALQNKINPFVAINQQNADGSETRQFIRPPMMGAGQGMPAIGSVVDDPRKQGGPMPQASGGFPYR